MVALITSDIHLNDNPRDYYRHKWVGYELPKLCNQHNVDTLIFLGDLTDNKDNHSAALVNQIVDHLSRLIDNCQRIIMLRGNHDYEDPNCPFFKFVEAMPGFAWINTPEVRPIEGVGNALFLPHTRDHKREWGDTKFVDCPVCGGSGFSSPGTGYGNVCSECGGQRRQPARADIIFAHNTFAGTISESGKVLGGIPTTVFPDGVPVISGDIHKPQQVGCVTYVGSPYTIDFGDNFQPRVLLLDGGKVRSVKCAGAQKRLVQAVDAKQALRKLEDAKGDIIKLRVAIPAKDKDNWLSTKRQLLEDAARMGVQIHTIEPILEKSDTAPRYRVSNSKAQRDDEIVKAYCKQQGVEAGREKVGLEIIKG